MSRPKPGSPGQGTGGMEGGHARPGEQDGSWAAAGAADLGGGGHADLGDKGVTKQAEDLLLLDLLGRGEFGRRRDGRAFPELIHRARGRAGSTGWGDRQTRPRLVTRPRPTQAAGWMKQGVTAPRDRPQPLQGGGPALRREHEKGAGRGRGRRGEQRGREAAALPAPLSSRSRASSHWGLRRAGEAAEAVSPAPTAPSACHPQHSSGAASLPPGDRRLRCQCRSRGLSAQLPSVSSSRPVGEAQPSRAAARSGGPAAQETPLQRPSGSPEGGAGQGQVSPQGPCHRPMRERGQGSAAAAPEDLVLG